MNKVLYIFLAVFIIASLNLAADQRAYVWTYQYQIMSPGESEFEQYTTFSAPDASEFKGKMETELNFELEIGMTDFFDFAVYQNFVQAPDKGLFYDGFKLRSRFKIGKKDQFFMDPLIYIEYIGVPDLSEHTLETKLILAKDIGNFNISLNPILEFEKGEEDWEVVPEYALGLSYGITHLLRFGLESKGSKDGYYLGPTISHGMENLWMALGSQFALGNVHEGKPEFQIRMILGVAL